jgi:hypothetical protein
MNTKYKGFLSLGVLLFVSVFLSLILSDKIDRNLDFVIVKSANTKKHSETINFEELIKRELSSSNIDPVSLNLQINTRIVAYLNDLDNQFENWFIEDSHTKKRTAVSLAELNIISKTIVLKPTANVYIKRYTITNGINKDKFLGFEMHTSYSKTNFVFPKNYTVEVIVYT